MVKVGMRVYAVAAQIKRPARSRSYLYYYIIYYGSDNGDGDRSIKVGYKK